MNLPKYSRNEGPRKEWRSRTKEEQTRKMWRPREQEQRKQQKLSFAQVVSGKKVSSPHGAEAAFQFNVKVESSSWLDRCFVGCLAEAPNIQLIKESFMENDI